MLTAFYFLFLFQRIIVEMAQMASRPFAVCAVEIPSNNPPIALKKEPPDLRASRRKKVSLPCKMIDLKSLSNLPSGT